MHRILAIAGLTLRAAVRSKVFALLAVLVAGGILGLPAIMKSDGTLAGQVRLFLEYALGLSAVLLSAAAVWAGAGAISLEVESRRIQLVAVKPVRAWEIWIGKWLGLMAVNAMLLGAAGALIYGLLIWTTRPARLAAEDRARLREEILVARREMLPAAGGGAEGRQVAVAPGGTGQWRFELPRGARAGEPIFLRFRFATSRPYLPTPVAGLWRIGFDGQSAAFQRPVLAGGNREYSFRIPVPEGCRLIDAGFANVEEQVPVTLLFGAADGATLLINAGLFEANYLRALLTILARLAFFSALGLTAGAVFSFPVAVFVSLALLLMTAVNRWLQAALASLPGQGAEDAGPAAILWDWMTRCVFRALGAILPPLSRWDPLDFLPEGRLMTWGFTGQAWLALVGVSSAILAVLGAWWFSRRELGLPTE